MTQNLAIAALLVLTAAGCAELTRGDAPRPDATSADVATDATTPVGDVTADAGDIGDDGDDADVPAVSFAAEVHSVLMTNCAASGCHGGAGNGLVLTGEVNADYQSALAQVEVNDSAGSRLLRKASGTSSHAGGPVLPTDSAEYNLIATWIDGGAQP